VPSSRDSKGNDVEDESGWMTNRLTFIPESSGKVHGHPIALHLMNKFSYCHVFFLCSNNILQDDMARKDDPNEYVVHDPLLEKGKEKFNKIQAKLKRRDREWAGKSLT